MKLLDSNNNYSLLKLILYTGRKHQLRKQLLIRGHPILVIINIDYMKKILLKKNKLNVTCI